MSDASIIFFIRPLSRIIRPLVVSVILGLLAFPALAQTPTRRPGADVPSDVRTPPPILRPDTIPGTRRLGTNSAADTAGLVRRAGLDSLQLSTGSRRRGDVETTVKYAAKDSIRFNVQEKKATLYDKANVDYGEVSLKAAVITVDYSKNLINAEGAPDSLGKVQDKPVFKNGAENYEAGRINYNFKTKKGKIAEAVTQQGEGYVHAEVIKKNQYNEIYGRNGRYTTCNLSHPHFFINASKIKMIAGEKIVTGPFNLVIGDIPLPLGLPFGYFPSPSKSRASGLIIPTFGSSTERGFFLRNGGYYWAASDNIGLRLTGDVYSGAGEKFGGWRGTAEMQYIKRYRYSGLLSFEFSSRPVTQTLGQDGTTTSLAAQQIRKPQTFWLTWSHAPTPRPGGGRFSASVRAGSSDFNRQNSIDPGQYLAPAFNSTVSYSKQLRNAPINYAINASQSQNTQTGTMDFTLPDITVGVARQYPYQWLGLAPTGKFYEQFAFSYTLNAQNRLTNTQPARSLGAGIPLLGGSNTSSVFPIELSNVDKLLGNAQTSILHQFQISLGSYNLLKFINLAPSINYNEAWYLKKLSYEYDPVAQAVRIDTLRQFRRVSDFSSGFGVNFGTNIYGLYQIKGKKIEAIRHKVTPNISVNYVPGRNARGSAQRIDGLPYYGIARNTPDASLEALQAERDPLTGNILDRRYYSYYQGFTGAPSITSTSAAGTIGFSLQNAVEMKVRDNNDTTGTTPFKKVSLIDGLDLNFSYNFLADPGIPRLSPITTSFRTQVARKLNILVSATFEPYQRDSSGAVINKYLFDQERRRLARLANASMSLNYQFNPSQKPGRKSNISRAVAPANDPALGSPIPINPYEDYVDFELPWELSSGFTAQYTDPGPRPSRGTYVRPRSLASASLNLSGSVKLTENTRVGYTTNYDFINGTSAFTSLDIFRDLHCWQITGTWRPFRGYAQGYFVTIAAKSSLLQDLKLNRNRTFLNR
ncbi:putative LPS assembly protein LptD [uncultured Hymenobacter sp.]|uniref:putative LPS assembly protein LptD n=1 Tax=uncultured Hymenobacter sp. TaxID=170016 RepID=UPI0035CA4322